MGKTPRHVGQRQRHKALTPWAVSTGVGMFIHACIRCTVRYCGNHNCRHVDIGTQVHPGNYKAYRFGRIEVDLYSHDRSVQVLPSNGNERVRDQVYGILGLFRRELIEVDCSLDVQEVGYIKSSSKPSSRRTAASAC